MRFFSGVLLVAGAIALSGCAHNTISHDAMADQATVIGKFRLVKNGSDVRLGNGFFANQATLDLVNRSNGERLNVDVGDDGEFVWALDPGTYALSSIDFMVRGERVSIGSNFVFDAASENTATYVGTVTLETTFDSGYYGMSGAIDNYSIVDDCYTDCAGMLSRLGLDKDAATIALLRPAEQLLTAQ